MISKNLLPAFFKEVITHIPTLALKSMDWKGLLKELGPVLLRLGKDDLEQGKIELLKKNLKSEILFEKHDQAVSGNEYYEKILMLYFDQLNNPEGLVLDIRKKYFAYQNEQLKWKPNNVWFKFNDNFRVSLLKIYKGFYYEDDKLFSQGLIEIGLAQGLNDEKREELEVLFKTHFGAGGSEPIHFKLQEFQESFYHMFKFFVDNSVELKSDFMFLGIYLVTLYMNLENCNEKIDVKKCFLTVFPQ